MLRDCIVCGKELEGRQQKYCSKRCRRTHENEVRDRKPIESITCVCIGCGIEFHPKAADRNKYCSRECAFEHKKAKPKVKIKQKQKHLCVCVICGKEFESERNIKYCSDDCRKEKDRYESYIRNTAKPTECRWCGVIFIPEYKASTYVYCCDEHRDLANKQRQKENPNRRLHKGGVSKAKRKRVYQRDNYTCKLCGKKLLMDKADTVWSGKPHPLAPTVDHIIPKSIAKEQGWNKQQINAETNLQAAHFKCNCLKGNRGANDQMLLFG